MRLFAYYALHTLKNQIKKLFKTWIAVFIAVCLVFGIVVGVGAALVAEHFGGEQTEEQIEEPEKEDFKADPQAVELIVGGVLLLLIVIDVMVADKSASAIFLRADVDLLFASPMHPQSVLLFRLLTQLGLSLAAGLYFLFQIPNLMFNAGISGWGVLGILAAWMMLMLYGKLIQVFIYTAGSVRPAVKKLAVPVVYGIIIAVCAAFFLYFKNSGQGLYPALCAFFNSRWSLLVPVWGWIKALFVFIYAKSPLAILAFLVLAAGLVLSVYAIWRIKADFYEEAMAKAEELAARREKMQSGKKAFVQRKKDRGDKLKRDVLNRGRGATVYFWKSLCNRARFAPLGIFTKTCATYLFLALGTAAVLRVFIQTRLFFPVALVCALFAFYRSLGNPLAEDTGMDSFILVPDSLWKKTFFSLAAGSVNCLLDMLPGMIAAAILLGENPLSLLAWVLFVLSIDYYSSNVGVFIDLSVPVSAGKTLKQLVQIIFLYFGILPTAALFILITALSGIEAAAVTAAAFNIGVGSVFFAISPMFLERGRK